MQRSFAIGVLVSDVANPSSADFVRGVEDVATREKCTLLLCNTDGDEDRQLAHMRALIDRQVDGIVLISQHCSSPRIRTLLEGGPPFVLVQRRNEAENWDYVGSDNEGGIAEALRYVHGLGHRDICFIRGPVDSSSARERRATFRLHAAELGLLVSDDMIYPGDYTFSTGVAAAQHFLRTRKPTCILACCRSPSRLACRTGRPVDRRPRRHHASFGEVDRPHRHQAREARDGGPGRRTC